jgi:small subunit ribosomal protein S17
MQKTVAVEVSQYYRHPKYHKYIKTSRKFLTHDEEEECNVGDVVEIRVCRPLSRHKHFTLHKVLKPKLPIEVGAARFEANLPAWKKLELTDEQRAALELESGQKALQEEAAHREQVAQREAERKAAREARPAQLEAAKKRAEQLEQEAAEAAAAHAKLADSLSPAAREEDKDLQAAHERAVEKALAAIEAQEEVKQIQSQMKPVIWASS